MHDAHKTKWIFGVCFTLFVSFFPSGVAILATGGSQVLGWLLLILGLVGGCIAAYCGVQLWNVQKSKSMGSPAGVPIASQRPRGMSRQEYALYRRIIVDVLGNHGHDDISGITSDYFDGKSWAEIQRGPCSICNKPRNEQTQDGIG